MVTQAAGTFSFRLPSDKLTVIREQHENKDAYQRLMATIGAL